MPSLQEAGKARPKGRLLTLPELATPLRSSSPRPSTQRRASSWRAARFTQPRTHARTVECYTARIPYTELDPRSVRCPKPLRKDSAAKSGMSIHADYTRRRATLAIALRPDGLKQVQTATTVRGCQPSLRWEAVQAPLLFYSLSAPSLEELIRKAAEPKERVQPRCS